MANEEPIRTGKELKKVPIAKKYLNFNHSDQLGNGESHQNTYWALAKYRTDLKICVSLGYHWKNARILMILALITRAQ